MEQYNRKITCLSFSQENGCFLITFYYRSMPLLTHLPSKNLFIPICTSFVAGLKPMVVEMFGSAPTIDSPSARIKYIQD